jgi:hypothetical protein
MIHAVSAANQHLYARELDQMFRQRESGSGFASATDELDDDQAVYLMRIDVNGTLLESVRFNPSLEGWRASLWPADPSDALIAGVLRFCEQQGIPPLQPPANISASKRAGTSRS